MRLVLAALAFCLFGWIAGAHAQTTNTAGTELIITVLDKNQVPVPGMQVTVAHKGWLSAISPLELFSRDPDYKAVTNADGRAVLRVFPGRYTGEQWFGTTLNIEVTDQAEGKSERLRTVEDRVKIHYGLPSIARTLVMLPASESTDPVAGIPVNVRVIDETDRPVEGARVSLQSGDMSQPRERLTNAQGYALMEATVRSDTNVGVTASKTNFKEGKSRFRLNPKMRTTGTIIETVVTITTLRAADVPAQIRVIVTNSKDNSQVGDARVRFLPLDPQGQSFGGSTGPDGVALLANNSRGRFKLEVTQDNFLPGGQAEVTLERKDISLLVALQERAKKEGDSKVDVTVLAADKKDARGRPMPIAGAMVTAGNLGSPTDENGKATVAFTGQLGVTLNIEAPDYKPQVLTVPGGRYVVANHARTVQLQPADANAATPLYLTVRVVDSASVDQPIAGAKVEILLLDGRSIDVKKTDQHGEAAVAYAQDLARLARQGLTAHVTATGYALSETNIPASLLQPSKQTIYYLVNLDSSASGDLNAIGGEVARLEKLKAEIARAQDQAKAQAEKARQASLRADEAADAWRKWVANADPAGITNRAVFDNTQAMAFCKASWETAKQYERTAARLLAQAERHIEDAEKNMAACDRAPSVEGGAAAVRAHRVALAALLDLRTQSAGAAARRDGFLKQVELGEKGYTSQFLAPLRKAVAEAEAAASEAARIVDGLKPKREQLAQGKSKAAARVAALRARKLLPAHYGTLDSLKKRIDALELAPVDVDVNSNISARNAAGTLAAALQLVGAYSEAGCKGAREVYPRAVQTLEANTTITHLALQGHISTLPQRAEQCRLKAVAAIAQAARNSAPPPSPPAPAPAAGVQWVDVPNLIGNDLPFVPGLLQAKGLNFGGASGVSATAAGQSGVAWQLPAPGSRVQAGTSVHVGVWVGPDGRPVPFTLRSGPPAVAAAPAAPYTPPAPPLGPAPPAVYQPPATAQPTPYPPLANAPAAPAPNRGSANPAVTPPNVRTPATGGVPYVVGDSFETAVAKLRAAGLNVGAVERGTPPPTPDVAGRVYYQAPVVNSPLPANRLVALKVYGSMRETAAVVPTGDGVCLTSEGPLRCTGRFIGRFRMTCKGPGPPIQEGGPATVVLSRDGTAEMLIPRANDTPFSAKGPVNGAGQVNVATNRENKEFHQWTAQFRVVAAAQGLRTLNGTGNYKGSYSPGNVLMMQCEGAYSLP